MGQTRAGSVHREGHMADIAHFSFEFPGLPNVGCVFTTRCGGHSSGEYASANLSYDVHDEADHVYKNRVELQKKHGFVHWQELKQVHGVDMVFDKAESGAAQMELETGDGIGTMKPRTAVVIKTADCQPVMLAHKSGNYVGGLHVGWRGNVQNFPAIGVHTFCKHYRLKPKDILAVRGPSLGPLAAEFTNFDKEFPEKYRPFYDEEKKTVNLWDLTRAQLASAGVPDENIHEFRLCTKTMGSTFFSYRNAWYIPGHTTGRQAGVIWIK